MQTGNERIPGASARFGPVRRTGLGPATFSSEGKSSPRDQVINVRRQPGAASGTRSATRCGGLWVPVDRGVMGARCQAEGNMGSGRCRRGRAASFRGVCAPARANCFQILGPARAVDQLESARTSWGPGPGRSPADQRFMLMDYGPGYFAPDSAGRQVENP